MKLFGTHDSVEIQGQFKGAVHRFEPGVAPAIDVAKLRKYFEESSLSNLRGMPRSWLQKMDTPYPWIEAKPRSYTLHFSDRTVLHTDHGIFNLTQNVELLFVCYKSTKKTAQIGGGQ